MDALKIGLLLPSSTILPIARDFEKGIKQGIASMPHLNIELELIKEFVGQGGLKVTGDACNKLFNYHDVDLITGVLSNRTIQELADRFHNQQVPIVVNNPGAHIPDPAKMNDYIFINSDHLWRHAWSLGYWGVKEFGRNGMFIGSVYEAGYSFSQMFYAGMHAADPQSQWSFAVPPMPPAGDLSNMDVIFPFLEQYQPDFVFAAFCGKEATLFLNEFIARGWHKRTRLTGLPYLLCPFNEIEGDLTVYTTAAFHDDQDLATDQAFYRLGIETGQAIIHAAATVSSRDELKAVLAESSTLLHAKSKTTTLGSEDIVSMLKHEIKARNRELRTTTLGSVKSLPLDPEVLAFFRTDAIAIWYNPYLCI